MSAGNGHQDQPELPGGWKWGSIGHACSAVEKVEPAQTPEEPFRYIDISAVDRPTKTIGAVQRLLGEVAPSRARQRIKTDDVLVSTVRPNLQSIAMVPPELDGEVASTGFCVLRAGQGLDPRWLFYWTLSPAFFESILKKARGVSYPAVLDKDVRGELMPLPPIDEQKRLVRTIETLLERIALARGDMQAALRRVELLKLALIDAAVWGQAFRTDDSCQIDGLLRTERKAAWEERSGGRGRYKEPASPLAPLAPPEGWTVLSVDSVCSLVTDGDHNPPKRQPEGIAHLTARHVHGYAIHPKGSTFISEADFQRVKRRYNPQTGDVIVTCVGTIGRMAVVPKRFEFSPDRNLAGLRPLPSVNPRFLMYVMASSAMQRRMHTASGSTAQPHLYLGDLRRLPVPVPPRPIQDDVVEHLDGRLAANARTLAQLRAAQEHGNSLRRAILVAAFRGRLTSRTAVAAGGAHNDAEVVGAGIELGG
jgi:type I restriction enzyme S subunit